MGGSIGSTFDSIVGEVTGNTPPPSQPAPVDVNQAAETQKLKDQQKGIDEQSRLYGFEQNYNSILNQERDARTALQKAVDQNKQIEAQGATGIGGGAGASNTQDLQAKLDSILKQKSAQTFTSDVPDVSTQAGKYFNSANTDFNSNVQNTIDANRKSNQLSDYINSQQTILAQKNLTDQQAEASALKAKQAAARASLAGLSVDPYLAKPKKGALATQNSNDLGGGDFAPAQSNQL